MSLAEKMAARIASKPPAEPSKPAATLSAALMEKHGIDPHPNSRIARALHTGGVSRTSELERIVALPRRVVDLDKVPDLTPRFILPKSTCAGCELCRKGPPKLWPLQSLGLAELAAHGGLFGAMAVGSGKTLTSLLAGAACDAKKIVLLVPPEVRDQLKGRDIPRLSRHFRLPLDRLHVVAYSELSIASKADILDRLAPDLIVADEAHKISRKESTRTKRFFRYLKEHPGTRVVALSGTMTKRSIRDFAALIEAALHKNSPLPNRYRELEEWAEAIDVPRGDDEPRAPGALLLLCEDGEGVRSGFRRRLVETPGVVATSEGSIGTSLYLRASCPHEVPAEVGNALAELKKTWAIGDEEFEDAAALARVAKQIACGFYYVWDWPDGEKDHEWLNARKEWHRGVRQFLQRRARAGVDSPLLVSRACENKPEMMGAELVGAWIAWKAVKDRPQPPTVPVWISKFLIDHAARWIEELRKERGPRGIVWYEHLAIEEALRAIPRLRVFGGGEDAELLACDSTVVAASALAHGTGKNLQHYSRNLVLCPSSSGARWEQLIGRTHRPGQDADEVVVDVCVHTLELREALEKAAADARYVEETQGQKQKLCYATRIGL